MELTIPLADREAEIIEAKTGTSIVFVGANGAGKTRLGVRLEQEIEKAQKEVHRIAAHRSLNFSENIDILSTERADKLLFYGTDQGTAKHKAGSRWGGNPATVLLSDFEHVLRALFAEQHDLAIHHLQRHRADRSQAPPTTKLDKLSQIWQRLLPHRELVVGAASVTVRPPTGSANYKASALSDGERGIFYLIGQALLVKPNSVLIVDEPELHIHRAILADLWDQIEGARKDVTFIYITHDLEFATTRNAEKKYVLTAYCHQGGNDPEHWELARIEETEGLPEEIVSRILGSRRKILFVEGDTGSLDSVIYRRVFQSYTAIARGGHDQVITSVASFGASTQLHRLGCVGLIDCDDQSDQEIQKLEAKQIFVLPVSEVENLLLLPVVFYAIARSLDFSPIDARAKTNALSEIILQRANDDLPRFCRDYARRRIDRSMKTVGLNSQDPRDFKTELESATNKIDVDEIVASAEHSLVGRIQAKDVYGVLRLYDNKGLLADAATLLNHNRKGFEEYVGRLLASPS